MKFRIVLTGILLATFLSTTSTSVYSNTSVIANPISGVTKQIGQNIWEIFNVSQIEVVQKPIKMYTTTRVNVRKHNTTDSSVLRVLNIAEKVKVYSTEDGWCNIGDGYIKEEYLSKDRPKDKLLVTENERYWLYQLVEAEAGIESTECRAWICSCVFNLMKLNGTPDNVVDMIFYKNMFSPTLDGRIYEVVPRQSTKEVVDSVLRDGVCTNALFFEAEYCHSSWHSTRQKIKQIDHTIFYR